jgi:hypothetical protein
VATEFPISNAVVSAFFVSAILERSLTHEHDQAKDPADAAELFDRWDSFGDYPSIYPPRSPDSS